MNALFQAPTALLQGIRGRTSPEGSLLCREWKPDSLAVQTRLYMKFKWNLSVFLTSVRGTKYLVQVRTCHTR